MWRLQLVGLGQRLLMASSLLTNLAGLRMERRSISFLRKMDISMYGRDASNQQQEHRLVQHTE